VNHLDHKIWGIAWPAILSNISLPVLGLVDAAILGHLPDGRFLGAVAIGSALLSFFYWGFSFLRMGTTGLVARARGAGDHAAATLVLARSAALALLIAALVLALHPALLAAGFALMAPQPDLLPLAQSYTAIRIASAPAVLVTYAIVGWFIGCQNTRWPMLFVVLTNLANIALDVVFIVGLGLGSDGAAIASVCAEYGGACLALWAVWHQLPERPDRALWRQLTQWRAYGRLLRSNRDLFLRTVCLLASFAFFTAQSDNLGTAVLAGNTLMLHLLMMAAYGLDGFAFAAEGLAGSALGAGRLDQFRRIVWRCARWSALAAVLASATFALAHPLLFPVLTDLPEVRDAMRASIWWLVAMPLAAAPSYLLDGVFVGAAATRHMMTTMLFSALLVYLPAWYLTRDLGNAGLWMAFVLFNAARGLGLYHVYRRQGRGAAWLAGGTGTAV
jgi:MATE family multidrug resistance protein